MASRGEGAEGTSHSFLVCNGKDYTLQQEQEIRVPFPLQPVSCSSCNMYLDYLSASKKKKSLFLPSLPLQLPHM